MNASVLFFVSVLLVLAFIAAELHLMRIMLADWLMGHRKVRWRQFPSDVARQAASSERRFRTAAIAAAAAILVVPRPASAQESAPASSPPAETSEPASPAVTAEKDDLGSAISVQLNLDYTTAYFYRGIIQEDTGLILQPAAKLTVNLFEQGDFKVDAYIATWNSFHSEATGSQSRGDFTEYWYESDLLGGVAFTKGKFSLATQYVFLTSPSDAFEEVQELNFILSFDDGEALGKFALHPYALLAIETGADASDGADSDTGTYLELGIAPGFSFDAGKTPVSITFPAWVGLSLHDYYQNAAGDSDTFGFFQIGVKASLPLPIGDRLGRWTLTAGIYAMFLGDNTAEYNDGDDQQVIGTVGLQWNF